MPSGIRAVIQRPSCSDLYAAFPQAHEVSSRAVGLAITRTRSLVGPGEPSTACQPTTAQPVFGKAVVAGRGESSEHFGRQARIRANKGAASAKAPYTALGLLQFLAQATVAAVIIGGTAFFGQWRAWSNLAQADGVVVFTGEPRRILAGIKVLSDGDAHRMLITGTELSVGTDTAEVIAEVKRDYSYWASCCIDLDPGAQNTFENARDAKRWAEDHGFSSLILVTSDYHMPRALLELRSALSESE